MNCCSERNFNISLAVQAKEGIDFESCDFTNLDTRLLAYILVILPYQQHQKADRANV